MSFSELGLLQPIVRAVNAAGYSTPTPIQSQAIPIVLTARDLLGVAQTGTGKTAAFALPIIHRLLDQKPDALSASPPAVAETPTVSTDKPRPNREQRRHEARNQTVRNAPSPSVSAKARRIRVLVLSPTRELALQIGESFATYSAGTPLRHAVVFGGVNQFHQVKALRHGVDILVATPGRLMDLREQGFIDLSRVQVLVLDEADRMLDMGFLPAVRRIAELLPIERQTLLFSATMPPEIRELADSILNDPASVEIAPVATTAENIEQSVYLVERPDKMRLLRHLLKRPEFARTLVFTKTKHGADKLARQLENGGFRVEAIHGNRSQSQRQRALHSFKCGQTAVLIATDLAARGIDVDGISHVINFDLPLDPDSYVHRIGRTARAGASGIAISFCAGDERSRLKAIERLIRQRLDVHAELPTLPADPAPRRNEAKNIVAARRSEDVFDEPFGIMDDDVVIAPRREEVSADRPVRPGPRRIHSSGRGRFEFNEPTRTEVPANGGSSRRRRFAKSAGGKRPRSRFGWDR